MKICAQCKTILYDDDQFCYSCGAEDELNPDELTARHNRKYMWLFFVAGAAVAAVLAGAVLQYTKGRLVTPRKAGQIVRTVLDTGNAAADHTGYDADTWNKLLGQMEEFGGDGAFSDMAKALQEGGTAEQLEDFMQQMQEVQQGEKDIEDLQAAGNQMLQQLQENGTLDRLQEQADQVMQQMQEDGTFDQMQNEANQMMQQAQGQSPGSLSWNLNMGPNP